MKGKIIDEKILSNNWGKFSQFLIEYTRSDGKVILQKREILDSGHGAVVLLYNLINESIILIKQFRLPAKLNNINEGVLIECVTGKIDPGESAVDAIIREVKEETGINIQNPKHIYSAFSSPGVKTEILDYFTSPYQGELNQNQIINEQEDIQVIELPFKSALNMLQNGEIVDAKTILLLQYAQMYIFTS